MIAGGRGVQRWIYRAGFACVLVLCAAPLAAALLPLLRAPHEAAGDAVAMLGSARLWGLWGKTCGIAAGTALLAALLGAPLGFVLARGGLRAPRLFAVALSLPLVLPPHVLAVAWIDLLGLQGLLNNSVARLGLAAHPFPLYTPAGVVLIQGLAWYALPMWTVWHGVRYIDPALIDAARIVATPFHVLRRVMLPLVLPAVATGALLVFLLALVSFSIPSLLQVPVFTVEIFTSYNSLLDPFRAGLMAVPLAVTGAAILAMASRLYQRIPGRAIYRTDATPRPRPIATIWASLFACAAAGLPLWALVLRSGTLSTFTGTLKTALQELGASLLLAGSGATVLLIAGIALTFSTDRRRSSTLGITALAYLASGPVLGVGLIQLWNHPGIPGYVYDRFGILLIAVCGRYFVFALLGCQLAREWLPRDAVEAARNLGATPFRALWRVALPVLRLPLVALWGGLATLIFGEVECIVLIAPPGWVPVSLRIYTLMHYGPAASVSALALLQALLAVLILAGACFVGRATGHRGANIYTPGKSRYDRVPERFP